MFQKTWHLYLTVKTGQDEEHLVRACPQTAVQVIRLVRFYCIVPEVYVCFEKCIALSAVAYPGILFGGVQQIQLRTEDRENRDLGAVAP